MVLFASILSASLFTQVNYGMYMPLERPGQVWWPQNQTPRDSEQHFSEHPVQSANIPSTRYSETKEYIQGQVQPSLYRALLQKDVDGGNKYLQQVIAYNPFVREVLPSMIANPVLARFVSSLPVFNDQQYDRLPNMKHGHHFDIPRPRLLLDLNKSPPPESFYRRPSPDQPTTFLGWDSKTMEQKYREYELAYQEYLSVSDRKDRSELVSVSPPAIQDHADPYSRYMVQRRSKSTSIPQNEVAGFSIGSRATEYESDPANIEDDLFSQDELDIVSFLQETVNKKRVAEGVPDEQGTKRVNYQKARSVEKLEATYQIYGFSLNLPIKNAIKIINEKIGKRKRELKRKGTMANDPILDQLNRDEKYLRSLANKAVLLLH